MNKLHKKFHGPYKIIAVRDRNTYVVDIPTEYGRKNIFNGKYLERYNKDDEIDSIRSVNKPKVIEDCITYEVEAIVKHRMKKGKYTFLTKWVGYDEMTWEKSESFIFDGLYNMIFEQYLYDNDIGINSISTS